MKILAFLPINLTRLMSLLFITFAVASCGSKKENKSDTSGIRNFENSEAFKSALNDQKVVCAEEGLKCPGFAAQLTFWSKDNNDYKLGRCSGTLFKNKYIITSSRCIPPELKNAGSDCTDQIKVLFPKTDYYNEESVKCSRVIQANSEPDIAVIELDHVVSRISVQAAPNTFVESAQVYSYALNPSIEDKNMGEIVKKSCKLSIDNAFFMTTSAASPQAVIYGNSCHIMAENSGAAVLSQGRIVGLVFNRIDELTLADFYVQNKVTYTKPMVSAGLMQNIGCINNLVENVGISCSKKELKESDLDQFISRTLLSFKKINPTAKDEQIEYSLGAGLKLELSIERKGAATSRTLKAFKQVWLKGYVLSGSSRP